MRKPSLCRNEVDASRHVGVMAGHTDKPTNTLVYVLDGHLEELDFANHALSHGQKSSQPKLKIEDFVLKILCPIMSGF